MINLTRFLLLALLLSSSPSFATFIGNPANTKNGGTGQSTYTDGQLLIGNSSTGSLTKSTLTAGSNVTITNGNGSIQIAASGGTFVQEFPSGTCTGSNTAFTLAFTPTASAAVSLYLDGLVQTQGGGNDYTISGSSITLATACASGQKLYAVYTK